MDCVVKYACGYCAEEMVGYIVNYKLLVSHPGETTKSMQADGYYYYNNIVVLYKPNKQQSLMNLSDNSTLLLG